MDSTTRSTTRITDSFTQLRYGKVGLLARYLYVKREADGSWTLSGATGPIGTPDHTFSDGGYPTKRAAYAAADAMAARDLAR